MLLSYYRAAESGVPVKQFDCFDDLIEVDGDLRGLFNDRNEDVSGCDWVVLAGRDDKPSEVAAGLLNERLQNQLQFREFISHQLSSVPMGFACTNLVWGYEEKLITPLEFHNAAHRRFAAPSQHRADEIWLIDGAESSYDLIELQAGLWAISRYRHRNPYAAGLMRTCAWWAMFKRWAVRDWQVFAEMFGLPLTLGYYEEGAGPESRRALEDAVKSVGQDGYAVLSSLTDLVIKETIRGGDSSTVYPLIKKMCDEVMTKLITGGTLNTDVAGVGSYNAAAVHESRGFKMKRHDAKRFEEMFVRDIGTTFIVWNGFDRAAPPRIKLKITRDELQRAQALEILGMAIELDEDQLREEFALRTPAPGKGVKFMATPAPDPNRAREEKKR